MEDTFWLTLMKIFDYPKTLLKLLAILLNTIFAALERPFNLGFEIFKMQNVNATLTGSVVASIQPRILIAQLPHQNSSQFITASEFNRLQGHVVG